MSSNLLLEARGLCKAFSGVRVLNEVSFDLRAGEVHVLAGENGAGKSTLIKILSGFYEADAGHIHYNDGTPSISVIHQELSLVDSMSVLDNIFLGREQKHQRARARQLCHQLDLDIDLDSLVEEHSMSVKNRIEIAKALVKNSQVLIMDEPTGALHGPEVEKLFQIIERLKNAGHGIVYISHKMEEIYRIADRISVLRDGRYIGTARAAELPQKELIRWMIGRELSSQFPQRSYTAGSERFRIEGFEFSPNPSTKVGPISFNVRAGEIVGIGGLQGAGSSELLAGVFGAFGKKVEGKTWMDGKPFSVQSPEKSIEQGLALLTNDRKGTGLVLGMSVKDNLTLPALKKFSPKSWLRPSEETKATQTHIDRLRIRLNSADQEASTLSGGNQQKVALGKWLETKPRVLFLDEPTKGVDVGAKHEIYELMNEWSKQGMAIVLISSEMPELLAMSDRVFVMHRGQITAELSREAATSESVLSAAMGA